MVKYKGNIIHSGSVVAVFVNPNWSNSMATYYPFIVVETFDGLEHISKTYSADSESPEQVERDLEFTIDRPMRDQLEARWRAERERDEALRLDIRKTVEVIKGRKVPKGTIGRIFWLGDTKYGSSVGLELNNGSKVFVTAANVRVLLEDDLRIVVKIAAQMKGSL